MEKKRLVPKAITFDVYGTLIDWEGEIRDYFEKFMAKKGITHCCPSSVQDAFSGGLYRRDALTDFFDEIRECCKFQYWFFGHYHENIVVQKQFVMLYEQMLRLKC